MLELLSVLVEPEGKVETQFRDSGDVGKARRVLSVCDKVGGRGNEEDVGEEYVGAVTGGRGYVIRRLIKGGRRLVER